MRDLAGGEIAAGLADVYPVPQQRITVSTTAADAGRVLGIALTKEEIVEMLGRLDFVCELGRRDDSRAGAGASAGRPRSRPISTKRSLASTATTASPPPLMRDELPPQHRKRPTGHRGTGTRHPGRLRAARDRVLFADLPGGRRAHRPAGTVASAGGLRADRQSAEQRGRVYASARCKPACWAHWHPICI